MNYNELFLEELIPAIEVLCADASNVAKDPESDVMPLEIFTKGLKLVIEALKCEDKRSTEIMQYFLLVGVLGVTWHDEDGVDPIALIRAFKTIMETTQTDIKFKTMRFTIDNEEIEIAQEEQSQNDLLLELRQKCLSMQEQLNKLKGVMNNEIRSKSNRSDR